MRRRLTVVAAQVTAEGFVHEVLAEAPGKGGEGESRKQRAGQDGGLGIATCIVE